MFVLLYHGKQHSVFCLTGLFKPVIHTLSTSLETYVAIFASNYISFAF